MSSQSDTNGAPAEFRLSAYSYSLPDGLIAHAPAAKRDHSRLLVLKKSTASISHRSFFELPEILEPGDLLVVNETKVVPAALSGRKASGGKVELLVLNPARQAVDSETAARACLAKSSKWLKPGTIIVLDKPRASANGGGADLASSCRAEVQVVENIGNGRVVIDFRVPDDSFFDFLQEFGRPPLPPYIKNAQRDLHKDRERYQTVYSTTPGSVAAPTAGLHFTERLIGELKDKDIDIAKIVLHVGPGTFIPVRTDDIRDHRMEPEFYDIPKAAADQINTAVKSGHRIIAVGTTSFRALESATGTDGLVEERRASTDLFVYPGYKPKLIRALVTNFHLPESTLFMLVCALGGTDFMKKAYAEAINLKYFFYSYGDACLILE
jgi:S-adenosylmethionine:tRNA ribosyltransferase-isomerase